MELILVLIALGVSYGIYLAAPILVAYLAYRIGQAIGRTTGIAGIQWLLPAAVIGLPISWAVAGYVVFKGQCANVPDPSYISTPSSRPDGFVLDDKGILQTPYHRSAFVHEQSPFQYYESSLGGGHEAPPFFRNYSNGKTEKIHELVSEYALVLGAPQKVAYWWRPPIYVSEIVVVERRSNKVIAKAVDLIFGGGLIGDYLYMPEGNYDYRYRSCGFVSKDIGVWRTRHGNNPRYGQYVWADNNFVSTALSLRVQSSESAAIK